MKKNFFLNWQDELETFKNFFIQNKIKNLNLIEHWNYAFFILEMSWFIEFVIFDFITSWKEDNSEENQLTKNRNNIISIINLNIGFFIFLIILILDFYFKNWFSISNIKINNSNSSIDFLKSFPKQDAIQSLFFTVIIFNFSYYLVLLTAACSNIVEDRKLNSKISLFIKTNTKLRKIIKNAKEIFSDSIDKRIRDAKNLNSENENNEINKLNKDIDELDDIKNEIISLIFATFFCYFLFLLLLIYIYSIKL